VTATTTGGVPHPKCWDAFPEDAPGLGYVERAKAELQPGDIESATKTGRSLSVKEALALARVAEPEMD
jgi:hypothetical protein